MARPASHGRAIGYHSFAALRRGAFRGLDAALLRDVFCGNDGVSPRRRRNALMRGVPWFGMPR